VEALNGLRKVAAKMVGQAQAVPGGGFARGIVELPQVKGTRACQEAAAVPGVGGGALRDPRDMVRARLPEAQCAPCGASLYPRCSREELGRRFLGRLTYLEVKTEGNKSMSGKRWSSGGVQGGVPRGPCDMAKAELLEV
jgi:hypothetical protein